MLGFFIKKWFFDLWDNLFFILLLNVGFSFILVVPVLAAPFFGSLFGPLGYATTFIGILLIAIWGGIVNRYTWAFSQGESFRISEFPQFFKNSWKAALVLGAVNAFVIIASTTGFFFYLGLNDFIGTIALAIMFWALIFWLILVQYYFPLNAQFEPKIRKLFRKSLLLFFDNPGFSLFMGIGSLFILVLSVLTITLFPGFAGLLLWHQTGLKLRMYKYDYLEAHPDADKKKIPWDTLLAEERERVGKRTLKGMIFPWKE